MYRLRSRSATLSTFPWTTDFLLRSEGSSADDSAYEVTFPMVLLKLANTICIALLYRHAETRNSTVERLRFAGRDGCAHCNASGGPKLNHFAWCRRYLSCIRETAMQCDDRLSTDGRVVLLTRCTNSVSKSSLHKATPEGFTAQIKGVCDTRISSDMLNILSSTGHCTTGSKPSKMGGFRSPNFESFEMQPGHRLSRRQMWWSPQLMM